MIQKPLTFKDMVIMLGQQEVRHQMEMARMEERFAQVRTELAEAPKKKPRRGTNGKAEADARV